MKQKWAIVGLGFISPRHRSAIEHVGDEVWLTCDIDPEKNADFANFYDLTDSPAFTHVDNVAICTPNDCHAHMIKECLRKGKRVICEKPIGLSSKELSKLPNDHSVVSVLQLRHHAEVKRLKKELSGFHDVSLKVVVKRDQSYWEGWKGDRKRSGGILFNLGVHYFDLLIHLFGDEYRVHFPSVPVETDRICSGRLVFPNAKVSYHLEIRPDNVGQERTLMINGREVSLSKQDNLSFEDLHKYVYEDFKDYKGILPKEASKAIKLIEQLRA